MPPRPHIVVDRPEFDSSGSQLSVPSFYVSPPSTGYNTPQRSSDRSASLVNVLGSDQRQYLPVPASGDQVSPVRSADSHLRTPRRRQRAACWQLHAKFDELASLLAENLDKRLDSMEAENGKLLEELEYRASELDQLNTELNENLDSLNGYLRVLGAKEEEIGQLYSSDVFNNLNDLDSRLNVVKQNLDLNKSKLDTFDSNLRTIEEFKKYEIISKGVQNNMLLLLFCSLVLLVIRFY
ncbi:hypothetical protein OGAPHI_007426 [Ogataea philodendri]|uniref:Uncharacterized protein n=1 Tax=Ogataea philodendri TaxID=1378263 RepID=A0A9P8NVZ7_9ASCO|nr:uncharacterized protein OGAPHI_007426 [Ogataea philodendri]KAH3660221.1 hypothetical protein OGAPHI_007426 [Ogataea philodendri]